MFNFKKFVAMEYRIYNDSCIKDRSERTRSKKLIDKQVNRLDRFVTDDKASVLNIYFNRPSKGKYHVTAIIKLKMGTVLLKQSGGNIEAVIYKLFDRLKLALSKRLHKYHNEDVRRKRNIRQRSFNDSLPELIELKDDDSDLLLKDMLKVLLNDLAKYVRRRLKAAEMTSALNRGKFKLQELLNDIYIIVYNNLDEIPRGDVESTLWLYRVTDKYLSDKFQELEFEMENFDRIENFVEKEYRSLEEEYTVDAEFEIIPLEELDEYERHQKVYSVNDLQYSSDDEFLLDDLTLRLDEKVIHEIIEKELAKLPVFKRTIMDLYLIDQMTIQEISRIKDVSEDAVEAVIREVNNLLKSKLSFI